MTVDKVKGAKEAFDLSNITGSLTSLMTQITSNITEFMDKLKEKFNFDMFNTKKETKFDLKKLMKHIKNKEDNNAIDLINKSETFKEIIDRLDGNNFEEKVKERELTWILSLFKEKTNDETIDEKELEWVLGQAKINRDFIEKEDKNKDISKEGIKFIINEINKDEEIEEKYTIQQIIDAYKKTKDEIKEETDNGEKMSLNKSSVLENIISFES